MKQGDDVLKDEFRYVGRNANLWVQCTKCHKWRKISQKVNDETVPTSNEAPWLCSWDYERKGASCDNPEDQDL